MEHYLAVTRNKVTICATPPMDLRHLYAQEKAAQRPQLSSSVYIKHPEGEIQKVFFCSLDT